MITDGDATCQVLSLQKKIDKLAKLRNYHWLENE
jgi:hypothetical protein